MYTKFVCITGGEALVSHFSQGLRENVHACREQYKYIHIFLKLYLPYLLISTVIFAVFSIS